jgi:hypothetical protein
LVEQSKRLSAAKGDITMSTRYAAHLSELETSAAAIEEMVRSQTTSQRSIRTSRSSPSECRPSVAPVRRGPEIPDPRNGGKIDLEQNELNLRFQMGGDRSTAAVDPSKIVAFDLAALLLTIEGRTQLPAFLIHDSPREADLGLSIYNRLFTMSQKLEEIGGTLFS